MLNIGTLETVTNNLEEEIWGHIKTRSLNIKIRLVSNVSGRNSDNSPDYKIFEQGEDNEGHQIGSAWLKIPNNPNSSVKEFLSITLDDPDFPKPLNVAAFPQGNGKWDVIWNRPKLNATHNTD